MNVFQLISIIIPVYNHEPELQQALASIRAQTYKNTEVIIIDDGSEEPITHYSLPITHQIVRQDNKGAPSARNRGVREAKGDYVIFWDADVIAEPTLLEKMIKALEEHSEASYVYANFHFGRKRMPARAFDAAALRENNYIHSTSLIRRAALSDKPWDESLKRFQDWDLWLTLLEQKKIGVYIPEYLFRVITHRAGMSHWLPSFAYRPPWRWLPGISGKVEEFAQARKIILKKRNAKI